MKKAAFVALMLFLWGESTPIHASKTDLGFRLAQVSANEGAFVYPSTTNLVWQVVRENGGKNIESMADFLARHSPRVHGLRPCFKNNCLWTKNLTRGITYPEGLLIRDDIWVLKVAPIWQDTIRHADWLVTGMRTSEDPCPIKPRTWGGPKDREKAIVNGLYPIGCFRGVGNCTRDSCNDGYTFYKSCFQDGAWACDPTSQPVIQSSM